MGEESKFNWKDSVVKIILAAIAAGLLGNLTGMWEFNKKFSDKETQKLFEEVKEQLAYYQEENKSCQDKVSEIERELYSLKANLQLVGALTNDIPLAMWLKDLDGNMLYVSPRYERIFLTPRGYKIADYNTDYDVWPKEVADAYRTNDMKALKSKEPLITVELVPNILGNMEKWVVIKFRREIGQSVVGIGGICFEYDRL